VTPGALGAASGVAAHAQVNEHMIAVNEAIGFTVSGQPVTEYRLDAAAVPEK
jgi:hypothetical protein